MGATGSIGTQTLDIIRQFPEHFTIAGIAGGSQRENLFKIGREFQIDENNIYSKDSSINIREFIQQFDNIDIFINAISGMAGIPATLEIIKQQKPLCLANKESLVAKGEWIMKQKKCEIIPIDSEHSSMRHLMSKVSKSHIKYIWLTASGGPFRDAKKFPKESFCSITKKDALKHPTWEMGAKISVDSATLMNKAFELIEAVRLFDMPVDMFKVVVHPQSIIHAAIETIDGNIVMEASEPSMLLPIARALFEAAKTNIPRSFSIPPFSPMGKQLSFEEVDEKRFPSIKIAKQSLQKGDKACEEMLTINDRAVEDFLQNKIYFDSIFEQLAKGCNNT